MKNLAFAALAALSLLAVSTLRAQSTQNPQDPGNNVPAASGSPKKSTARDETAITVRRTTRRTTTVQPSAATISARNNARLNARLRTTEQANFQNGVRAPRLDGGVVRAVRSNNPLQAINPGAPAEYGTGEEVTRHEPDDPFQRPQGLKLVVVEF